MEQHEDIQHNEEKTIEKDSKPAAGVSVFAYELLKNILIPDLLGKEERNILYWAGRNLARKFPLGSTEEIVHFFSEAGWGNLIIAEMNKNEMVLELSSSLINKRFDLQDNPTFGLEAGFIAEQIQNQRKCVTETYETLKRKNKIQFTVQWDRKDETAGSQGA
ncbi:YslB family protein [Fictibacillus sp. KU28468]|uniref:YslB family protein n=1 Tax=Fictibacillus sp. KU28468 TaxID=2991053 RepID=UPI00223E7002|nr:YslB family protein [Fictibacillus sp. KU28468]UZJ80365.1 YslB family protein [Fictibacillus sp. KU28468]